jgi:hypothetical protein
VSIVATPSIRLYVSPSVRRALGVLATLLEDCHYSRHARESICGHVAREGTLAGAPGLDPGDEADAEMVFVAELESAPFDSEAWDRDQGVLFDAEMLAEGTHPWPIPAVGDDDRTIPPDAELEDYAAWDARQERLMEEIRALRPISGGAPVDGPPYDPTPEDLADFAAWSDAVAMRRWYDEHPLSEFNAVRND